MYRDAVHQAAERLANAEEALSDLETAIDFRPAEKAWTAFLVAASTIYSKLEQGAKGSGRSEAWFGRKKRERRDNPVLRYIHFARNSDEHGIERVTVRQADSNFYPQPQKFNERTLLEDIQFYNAETGQPIGEPTTGYAYGPHLICIRAHDRRFNDFCDPPREALSGKGDGGNPVDVARAALPSLRKIIEEARELADD